MAVYWEKSRREKAAAYLGVKAGELFGYIALRCDRRTMLRVGGAAAIGALKLYRKSKKRAAH